jgi:ABC-type branched-subunit amino acid transport system ATPase component
VNYPFGEIPTGSGLEVGELSVNYGGTLAVDAVTLSAGMGRITGLIGPNGAGKTTIFNTCNGMVRPSQGTVRLFGHDVTSQSTAARARLGLGRTFQQVQVCNAMTVEANVSLAAEVRFVGRNPLRQFFGGRDQRFEIRERAMTALDTCGIAEMASRTAQTLSTGQRRLVELARVLAGGYHLLLLDEPSSGLDQEETKFFGSILRRVVAERGLGILLVEHDMHLVMACCSHIYVLDFGRLIFEGSPNEVTASQEVREAYLGVEGAEAERSVT